MKIKELYISNILTYKYHQNIDDASKIEFDQNLNLIIGQNGAGKSTALEVLNFIFKKALFTQVNVNHDFYNRKSDITAEDKKSIISPITQNKYDGFRLDPNWNHEKEKQQIKMSIELDDIDEKNIQTINSNKEIISKTISLYSKHVVNIDGPINKTYSLMITLNKTDATFKVDITPPNYDAGYLYLVNYNYYKEVINFHNFENPTNQLPQLYESFALIGGYRNYHAFNPSVSLQNESAFQQIQNIKNQDYSKGLNSIDAKEPSIFNLVRLRVASKHYESYGEESQGKACVDDANKQPFIMNINKRLRIINIEIKIDFTNKQKWAYSIGLFDIKRKVMIRDVNSLSSGQKAIMHLIFEAYGRGELNGGLVIIDEPELHLHHQFQSEYLRVIEELNREQKCQYILVTHSEALINSSTIRNVRRFALDENNYTVIKYPTITADDKTLVKILDNTRSTYAFFSKKVVLVEGETDRFFSGQSFLLGIQVLNRALFFWTRMGKEVMKSGSLSFNPSVYAYILSLILTQYKELFMVKIVCQGWILSKKLMNSKGSIRTLKVKYKKNIAKIYLY